MNMRIHHMQTTVKSAGHLGTLMRFARKARTSARITVSESFLAEVEHGCDNV